MAQEINPPRHQSARTRREPRRAPRPPRDQTGDLARFHVSCVVTGSWSIRLTDRWGRHVTTSSYRRARCSRDTNSRNAGVRCSVRGLPGHPFIPVVPRRNAARGCRGRASRRGRLPQPRRGPGGRPGWRVALSLWLGACPGRTRPALASRSASAPQPQLSAVRATPELGAPCPPPRLPGPGAHAAFLHPPLFLTVHRASGPAQGFVTCCLSSGTLRSCPRPQEVTWGPERPQG